MEGETEEFTPRAYQADLYEKAVQENTIIYLPTGSGKTYISVMLVKTFRKDLEMAYSKGGKRTIFVVNTVPLVTQQSEYLARHTGLICKGYSGDMKVDFWNRADWLKELDQNQVLVMTSQIFLDILNHGYISLNKINIIIFDECHRAVNDHPMRQIMQRFQDCPVEEQPRVLGLTATLLNANVKVDRVEDTIKTLETTFHATVASVESMATVQQYSTNPEEKVVVYSPPQKFNYIADIQDKLNETVDIVKNVPLSSDLDENMSSPVFKGKTKNDMLINLVEDIREHILTMGAYGGSKVLLMHTIQLETLKKGIDDKATAFIFDYMVTQMTVIKKILEDQMRYTVKSERIHRHSTPQVKKLFQILKEFNDMKTKDQPFCCIVFVKRRFTAKVLYHVLKDLKEIDSQFSFLIPEFMFGYANNPYKSPREGVCIAKWNKEALRKFRNGLCNCMIATDVVDEGVDIPTCTLIVAYDPPDNFRAYVQSKGRARHSSSEYILMISEENGQYLQKYQNFKSVEVHLQKHLIGKALMRVTPTVEDITSELYSSELEPYKVVNDKGEVSVVTEHTAISLINRYCSLLLRSKFSSLAPTWILHKVDTEKLEQTYYKVSLQLPSLSPLKTIIFGDPQPSIDGAKRAVALKTCIKLHEIQELNDNLLPQDTTQLVGDFNFLFPNWIEESTEDQPLPGTYAKKRTCKLVHPEALYGAFPRPGEISNLHVLDMKSTSSNPPDNKSLVFCNLMNERETFAILSSKPMPLVPSFPLFMSIGEVNVDVKVNYSTVVLSKEEIETLRKFHYMLFSDIVNVLEQFLIYDFQNKENCFLVVPLNDKWEIDWDIVKNKKITEIKPSIPVHITNSAYVRKIITPTYRGAPAAYIVTQICEHLTPESSFPSRYYQSYVHYYEERYSRRISNPKQPLLEVKPVAKKINYIKPIRQVKPGRRKRRDSQDEVEEHLVAELCNWIDFPSTHWLKATTLPSILHRVTQLLIADSLRRKIIIESHLGLLELPAGEQWPPLVIVDNPNDEPGHVIKITEEPSDTSCSLDTQINLPDLDALHLDSRMYPWMKDQEPTDLDRDIQKIQLIDIEYYNNFMSASVDIDFLRNQTIDMGYRNKPTVNIPALHILTADDPKGPSPVDILQALTTTQGQDAFNLERLETLGDSFLKFITTVYLYEIFPNYSEGKLTALRSKIIGNRNLYYCGANKEIPGRMNVDEFVPNSNFIVPAFTVQREVQSVIVECDISPNVLFEYTIPIEERYSGRIRQSTMDMIRDKTINWEEDKSPTGLEHFVGVQTVSDKSVADAVEALIAVYLKSMGLKAAAALLTWFNILSPDVILHVFTSTPRTARISEGNADNLMPWADAIEKKFGYKFKDRTFLLQAFTHPSYSTNVITECYQRLEFLGDAVLDFLITVYIYESCGELSPGALTDLRSALVNNVTFACLAVRYGLHTFLLDYAPKLNEAIDRFVKFQIERKHAINDELLWILLEEDDINMAEYVDVPKILSDLFESFIGAVYLDSHRNLEVVWDLVYSLMHEEITAFSQNIPKQPIRVLYETQGALPKFLKPQALDDYNVVIVPLEVTISGQRKNFYGFGANKKQARCAAAKQALKCLRLKP